MVRKRWKFGNFGKLDFTMFVLKSVEALEMLSCGLPAVGSGLIVEVVVHKRDLSVKENVVHLVNVL